MKKTMVEKFKNWIKRPMQQREGGSKMDDKEQVTGEEYAEMRQRNAEHTIIIDTADQVARLSAGKSHDQAFSFLLSLNKEWPNTTPATRALMCRESFGDSETLHIDIGLPHSRSAEFRLGEYDRWTRDRLKADITIIELVEAMRQRLVALRAANVKLKEVSAVTIRDEKFEQISRLCGKPKKLIAKVYDAIDWNDTRVEKTEVNGMEISARSVGPRARREGLVYENLTPEPELPPSAKAREQRNARRLELTGPEMALMQAQQDTRDRMTQVIYGHFLDMRTELNRYHTQQLQTKRRLANLMSAA